MRKRIVVLITVLLLLRGSAIAAIEFDQQIRPILADKCYKCHGPDQNQRQAELRLDIRDDLFAKRDNDFIVKPFSPQQSELLRRIDSLDDDQMPPNDSGLSLSNEEKTLLKRWIEEGANWSGHWSFVPPRKTPLPNVRDRRWPRNPVDYFILSQLEQRSLTPSQRADGHTLLRRASFDLTGLPLVAHDLNDFSIDDEQDYQVFIDRLLASPTFGERFATVWLDAARYADTSGYQNDGERHMWRWRDWVINAINRNMPFDQFTIQQIAGDMLPNATLSQQIATGFNRNHRGNSEGGIVPEEYAVEYVVDRVETTATVWLGLTIGCARCHDHKFDPISQTEFYQLFDYFNHVPESGRAIKEGNSPPVVNAPTPSQERELSRLEGELQTAKQRFDDLAIKLPTTNTEWNEQAADSLTDAPIVTDGLIAHFRFDRNLMESVTEAAAESNGATNRFAEGRIEQAIAFDGQQFVDAGSIASFGYKDEFTIGAWINPNGAGENAANGVMVSKMIDEPQGTGYQISLVDGHLHVNLIRRWLDDAIRVQTAESLEKSSWRHICVTYDGSRVARGIQIYVDGEKWETKINLDFINQSFATSEPLRIGRGGGDESQFVGQIDDLRIYDRVLTDGEIAIASISETVSSLMEKSKSDRTDEEEKKLELAYLTRFAPDEIKSAFRRWQQSQRLIDEYRKTLPTVMVMKEGPKRTTHFLKRGQYDAPGDVVSPNVPSCLPPLTESRSNNRLGLAHWLVDSRNPLTARVTVNRIWQSLFGQGIVRTTEDFGTQGERPSHPKLLDWLAVELMESGWDVKHIVRLIVTSATYRQSSRSRPMMRQIDADNRLLSQGPRFRLTAEMIRDQSLAAAGILNLRIGGPSVKPYQPAGLWKEIASDTVYDQATGADLYRRSLYTFWKRTVASPMMANFDASMRETCVVRKPRTNTPLQALTLMNDVTFFECARVLAERCISKSHRPSEQLKLAFRSVLSRDPSDDELAVLTKAYDHHRKYYGDHPEEAAKTIAVGEYACSENWPADQLASLTLICSLIFNLDEAVTKE